MSPLYSFIKNITADESWLNNTERIVLHVGTHEAFCRAVAFQRANVIKV